MDGRIIGFSCYGPSRDTDLPNCGEVSAIYILKEAQGFGIGRKLMDAAFKMLSDYQTISVWVLQGNEQAIGFYEHYGFHRDGAVKQLEVGTTFRMITRNKE